jgi:hypothetical protein
MQGVHALAGGARSTIVYCALWQLVHTGSERLTCTEVACTLLLHTVPMAHAVGACTGTPQRMRICVAYQYIGLLYIHRP